MASESGRNERVLLLFLLILGTVDFTVNIILSQRIVGSFLTQLLVVGLIVLAVELLYRHGTESWTVLVAFLIGIGAVSDALVTFTGAPELGVSSLIGIVPKVLWGLGLLITFYSVRERATKRPNSDAM